MPDREMLLATEYGGIFLLWWNCNGNDYNEKFQLRRRLKNIFSVHNSEIRVFQISLLNFSLQPKAINLADYLAACTNQVNKRTTVTEPQSSFAFLPHAAVATTWIWFLLTEAWKIWPHGTSISLDRLTRNLYTDAWKNIVILGDVWLKCVLISWNEGELCWLFNYLLQILASYKVYRVVLRRLCWPLKQTTNAIDAFVGSVCNSMRRR